MESITSEGWTCPICGTVTARVVGRVESMETVDYAETIRQLRAELDAATARADAAEARLAQVTALLEEGRHYVQGWNEYWTVEWPNEENRRTTSEHLAKIDAALAAPGGVEGE